MDGGYLHGQQLLRVEEVAQVVLGVERVYYRRAVGLDGGEVHLPLLVLHVDDTFLGEEHAVAAVAGGHDMINCPMYPGRAQLPTKALAKSTK